MDPSDNGLVALVVLLADEVVTNAIVHGQGPIDIAVEADEERVKVMVRDRSEIPPCPGGRRGTPREVVASPSSKRSPRDGVSWARIREKQCGSRSTGHPPTEATLPGAKRPPWSAPQRGNGLFGHGVP